MPIHHRTPLDQQARWQLVGGALVSVVTVFVSFALSLYVAAQATSGHWATIAAFVGLFWCLGAALLIPGWQCVAELRRRSQGPRAS